MSLAAVKYRPLEGKVYLPALEVRVLHVHYGENENWRKV